MYMIKFFQLYLKTSYTLYICEFLSSMACINQSLKKKTVAQFCQKLII